MNTNGTSVLKSFLLASFIVFVFFFLFYIFSSSLFSDDPPPPGFTIVKAYNSKNSLSKLFQTQDMNVFILGSPMPGGSSPLEVVIISDFGTVNGIFKLDGRFTGFIDRGESFYISSDKGLWRFDEDGEPGGYFLKFKVKKIADGYYGGFYERDGKVFSRTETGEIELPAEKTLEKSSKDDDIYQEVELNRYYRLLKRGGKWYYEKNGDANPEKLDFPFPVEKIYRVGNSLQIFTNVSHLPSNLNGVNKSWTRVILPLFREKMKIAGDIFIFAEEGIWTIDDSGMFKAVFKGPVDSWAGDSGSPYFLSNKSLWHINDAKAEKVTEIEDPIYTIKMFRSQLLVGTITGLWRISDNGKVTHLIGSRNFNYPSGVSKKDLYPINNIIFCSGSVWAGGGREIFRLEESNEWKAEAVAEGTVIDVIDFAKCQWVCTNKELIRIQSYRGKETKEAVKGLPAELHSIREMQGALWLDSSTGLWRVDASGNAEKIINIYPKNLVRLTDGSIIAGSYNGGLYRIFPEGAYVRSYSRNSVFRNLEKRFPKIWISGSHFLTVEFKPSYDVYKRMLDKSKSFDLSENLVGSRVLIPGKKRNTALGSSNASLQVEGWGEKTINYDMRDENGNHFKGVIKGFVIPSGFILLVFFLLVWILFWISLYHLSSRAQFAMNLLMNPYLRKMSFLGLFEQLLSEDVLPVDSVMKRYLKNLKMKIDEETGKTGNSLQEISSFVSSALQNGDLHNSVLQNEGEATTNPPALTGMPSHGIIYINPKDTDKCNVAILVADYFLEEIRKKKSLPGMIPVIIPESRLKTDSLKENICLELKTMGGINDESFVTMLLNLGVFVVIIEGMKGFDEKRAEVIRREINEISKNNLVIVL